MDIEELDWSELPPVPSLDGAKLEVRVYFAYDEELNGVLRQTGLPQMIGTRSPKKQ